MDEQILSAFAKEVRKLSGAESAFSALDRAGQLAGSGLGKAVRTAAGRPPSVGSFGIGTFVNKAAASGFDAGVVGTGQHTAIEDTATPKGPFVAKRKTAMEGMDREKWIQTAKDIPTAIIGSALGYGLTRTAVEALGDTLAKGGQKPPWLKHVPAAVGIGTGLASFASSRVRDELRKRREEAAKRAK